MEEGVGGNMRVRGRTDQEGTKKRRNPFCPLLGIRRRIISRKGPYRPPPGILPCLIIRVLHLEIKEEGVSLSFLLSLFLPLLLLLPALDNEALFRPLRSHRREKERRRRRTLRLTFSTLTTQKAAPPSSAEREGGRPSLKACLPPPLACFPPPPRATTTTREKQQQRARPPPPPQKPDVFLSAYRRGRVRFY